MSNLKDKAVSTKDLESALHMMRYAKLMKVFDVLIQNKMKFIKTFSENERFGYNNVFASPKQRSEIVVSMTYCGDAIKDHIKTSRHQTGRKNL